MLLLGGVVVVVILGIFEYFLMSDYVFSKVDFNGGCLIVMGVYLIVEVEWLVYVDCD